MTSNHLRRCAALLVAVSVSVGATTAFAQSSGDSYSGTNGARSGTLQSFGNARAQAGASRQEALRDCVAQERRSQAVRDSNVSLFVFRACMYEHGQPE